MDQGAATCSSALTGVFASVGDDRFEGLGADQCPGIRAQHSED